MMRIASCLLVAVLLTTCAISGTFAKYITSDDANDSARVAKWGVTVVANGSLYGEKYEDTANVITAETTENAVSVWGKQSTGPNALNEVVAPGTKSDDGFHFAINGKPEVDSLITMDIENQNVFLAEGEYGVMVKVNGVTADNFDEGTYYTLDAGTGTYTSATAFADAATYYELHDAAEVTNAGGYWPVVYKMEGNTPYTGDHNVDTLKAIADEILANISTTAALAQDGTDKSKYSANNVTLEIEQNTDLATALEMADIKLSWEWAFDSVNDGADTILGNLMASRIGTEDYRGDVVKLDGADYVQPVEGTDFCLDTNFSIGFTVEQVD